MNPDAITTVAVLGLGTMGHGIAQSFAAAGLCVRCFDGQAAARATLHERIEANLRSMTAAGLRLSASIPAILARLVVCDSEADTVQPAQFIVEAVAEDLAVKQALFGRIEESASPEAIVASNSSSLPISATAARMRHPERAVLTHWFNPPHIIPVVEVVPGRHTTDAVTEAAVALLARIGKTPVRVRQELPGFLVNRVQVAMFREIWDLLERGVASAEEIDAAIQGSVGLRLAALGPLRIIDFAGWDITGRVYENLAPDLRSDARLHDAIRALVERGHLGVKTGQGIFSYPAETADAQRARRDRLYLAIARVLRDLDQPAAPATD